MATGFMSRYTWKPSVHDVVSFEADVSVFVAARLTSHVGNLDAGVPTDRAPLCSRWGLVPYVPRQGTVAAVAAQVPPAACFGAEPCWGLDGETQIHFVIVYFQGRNILCVVILASLFLFTWPSFSPVLLYSVGTPAVPNIVWYSWNVLLGVCTFKF